MNNTQLFQNEVASKMSQFFQIKLSQLIENENREIECIITEYNKQFEVIRLDKGNRNISPKALKYSELIITALSEPKTYYKLGDFLDNSNYDNIYSPRIDLSFSPTIKMIRGKNRSIGVYKLTSDVQLFSMIHQLDFVKDIEKKLRVISNNNLEENLLQISCIGLDKHSETDYINRRPLHLFGFEIENQKNSKHLMGDFLNAISLSRIPVVIIPEDKYLNMMRMLKFSSTIKKVKEVPIYDIFKNVNVMKMNQFKDCINQILLSEGIESIQTSI